MEQCAIQERTLRRNCSPAAVRVLSTLVLCSVTAFNAGFVQVFAQDGPTAQDQGTNTNRLSAVSESGDSSPETSTSQTTKPLKPFSATAYCLKGRTASGVPTQRGIVAADPKVLPLGSVVKVHAGKYSGVYRVMDTGAKIRGNKIDVYVPTSSEAMRFGRQAVKLEVLSYGQSKRNSRVQAKTAIKKTKPGKQ